MEDYSKFDDLLLQRLAAEGDRSAEAVLTSRYMELVRSKARLLFLAGGDKNDLIQEGTVGLIQAIRHYSPERNSSFRTFADYCIHNSLLTAVKNAASKKHVPLNGRKSFEQLSENSCEELSIFPEAYRLNPEYLVLERESEEELYKTFTSRLSKLEQKVLSAYLDGKPYSVIAEEIGKDAKAVDNAIQRIRKKLAQTP